MRGWLTLRVVLRLVLDDVESGDARLAAMLGEKVEGIAASRVRAVREAFRDACPEHSGIDGPILLRARGIPLEDRLAPARGRAGGR